MATVPNFTASQSSGTPSIITLNDTSTGTKIIDEDILMTRNSVYAIHNPSKIRDKILNDLGI